MLKILAYIKLIIFFALTLLLLIFFFFFKIQSKFTNFNFPHKAIRKFWAKSILILCNLKIIPKSNLNKRTDAIICNHISWLDIIVLLSLCDIIFVSKSEVKKWPGFGFLAQLGDTVFIERKTMSAKLHLEQISKRLSKSQKLCIFAEGTSSDGLKVLPFKSSLFDIFTSFRKKSNEDVFLQPVSIFYKSPENKKRDFYGWWGVMPLFPHIILVLSNFRIAKVYISFNEIINASKIGERKELSRIVENSVRNSFNNSNDS